MNILGLSGALGHDPSAAILVDGRLLAAAEEERFIREKHAKGKLPIEAARFCLQQAGLSPHAIDVVAYPYAPIPFTHPGRWHYVRRHGYAPDRALMALFNGNRRYQRNYRNMMNLLESLGIDKRKVTFRPIEHHLAHASSAYHLSGFKEKTALITIDGKGEYATTFLGFGENGRIHKIKEFYDPDSLGGMYGAFTEYLGFEMLDGEFKVMGMAPYGKAQKYDLSRLIDFQNGSFRINTRLVNVIGPRRYKENGKGYYFSLALVKWLGPKRSGDDIDDPYVDYAAALQKILEDVSLGLIQHYLGDLIHETGKLCFAGGVALNVKLNQKIMALDGMRELFVQPAASDAGTAVGAATYVAHELGESIEPQQHVSLGPDYTTKACIQACRCHPETHSWELLMDPATTGANILAAGHPLAWFQGRMEFGPRALGNRSILGDPSCPGIADRINAQIKYRERWRPFCPSILDRAAPEILQTDHPSPYMTFAFEVAPKWKVRIPEVVHVDGTARAQIVTRETQPRYYRLIEQLEKLRGIPLVLNTSLNRRGEPMVCSPTDTLNMFHGSELPFLIMEDLLIRKPSASKF